MYMTDERPAGVPADELAVHVVLEGPRLDRKLTALCGDGIPDRASCIAVVDPAVYAPQVAEEAFIEAPGPRAVLQPISSGRDVRFDGD